MNDLSIRKYFKETYIPAAFSTCGEESNKHKFINPGIKSEIGELYGVIKKVYRESPCNDPFCKQIMDEFVKEIGDVFWYVANKIRLLDCVNIIFEDSFYFDLRTIEILALHDPSVCDQNVNIITKKCDEMMSDALSMCAFIEAEEFYLTKIIEGLIVLCRMLQLNIFTIMEDNTEKLLKRKENGTLFGSGSNR